MEHNSETLIDDSGIEILVGYDYEKEKDYEAEPGNPATLVEGMTLTELTSVEVVIKGTGIDILPLMSDRQKEAIIGELSYE